MALKTPPAEVNADGQTRRVGVEIEFAGLPPRDTAQLVSDVFGGELNVVSPHRLQVKDTRWGDFSIELDTQYAHPDSKILDDSAFLDTEWARHQHQMRVEFHQKTRELIGDMVTGLVPTEIVFPPVPWDALPELDELFEALREHGAKGTDASLLYGFGLHLNPEAAALDADYLLSMLRAYLLLAPWLREEINVDITREVLPHANPFPKEYALKIFAASYQPDLKTLIDDYLHDNPTRNRELDMLPLFAHIYPDHPHKLLHSKLTKPRPTFHYRLPNAQLSEPDWGAVTEWNRWVDVEELAADRDKLAKRCAAYISEQNRPFYIRWPEHIRRWWQRRRQ
ncbi:amidoligase family protein [Vreelandella salicampi]|uniref:Amidoligase family protein n=1 Tax=Vreelandella salicampi TaxID=1449798 RepID=A0A7Z0LJS3_9GAMM|nr:amidoligase family protein [Halomonas salicampi]NYS60282.1 amidoligase family protein [Halomonas salicampi]